MDSNPFLNQDMLNTSLHTELCQRIHYEATSRAVGGRHWDIEVPEAIPVAQLQWQNRVLGKEALLLHPEEVVQRFAGISYAVYQAVDTLYCSRLMRSPRIICRILEAMAIQAGVPPVAYEAVWAICMHLQERRQRLTAVQQEHTTDEWWLVSMTFEDAHVMVQGHHTVPALVCVIDASQSRVLAFRVTDANRVRDTYGLALYDALVLQRRPSRTAAGGLTWLLPRRLLTECTPSPDCQATCQQMGVTLGEIQESVPFLQTLFEQWRYECRQRNLPVQRWATAFDSFLHKTTGTSPQRIREHLDDGSSHLVGYTRDPTWQFPVLRTLLSAASARITSDGEVPIEGLHYADALLRYWPNIEVTLRRSEYAEASAWVYLGEDILCQAMARELRRGDGSYQPFRKGR